MLTTQPHTRTHARTHAHTHAHKHTHTSQKQPTSMNLLKIVLNEDLIGFLFSLGIKFHILTLLNFP